MEEPELITMERGIGMAIGQVFSGTHLVPPLMGRGLI